MLAVGGWNMGSELFIKAVKTNTSRADLATNAVKFLREHNFDGLDIDWEYPADRGSGPEDKENYIQLLKVHTIYFSFCFDSLLRNVRIIEAFFLKITRSKRRCAYCTMEYISSILPSRMVLIIFDSGH